ncbi:MAG: FAD-dependent 5-carboxymethylaminomethyl-2-thiouridine(34) oxidoreductase MnmC [Alphaproteobacteria bacterium]|nr:FAD-dependent 5-carboxymethylaminomethyl-2-thiouridine(34) oxidoreductase MnmC [Alphaproteobacteria bacterium]
MSDCGDRDPGLVIRDGVPSSSRFGDIYFSRDGGLAEAAHVFLDGTGLPDAWKGSLSFTIAETGFGTGLNFLATWGLWRRTRPPGGVLHYLAVEGYPIRRGSLPTVLAPFRALAPLSARLVARYPRPVPGLHRMWFAEDGVCLTLAIGDAAAILPRIAARVDAWYLDGFAPARNPSMWEPAVLDEVARLAAPGCRLATFTAAGVVRRGLGERGFAMHKHPGFGAKRDCLAGEFHGIAAAPARPGRVAVVGAGIAGASVVGALARRGVEVAWIDRRGTVAAEASGNPLGIVMPRPVLGDGPAGPLSAAAYRYALAESAERGVRVGGDGVLELAGDEATRLRHRRLDEAGLLDPVDGRLVDAAEASRIAGVALDRTAICYRRAGWISPRALVGALSAGIAATLGRSVGRIDRVGGRWRLSDDDGLQIADADAVVLAPGAGFASLPGFGDLPLRAVRGQLTMLPETMASRRLRAVLTFGGYLAPSIGGRHVAGATYERGEVDPGAWPQPVTVDGQEQILRGFPGLVGGWFDGVAPSGGRAAVRATTPDRLPIAGPFRSSAEAPPELYVLAGLGSRGLVTAPLLGEVLAAQMLGEPAPVESDLVEAVSPRRFALRRRRAARRP